MKFSAGASEVKSNGIYRLWYFIAAVLASIVLAGGGAWVNSVYSQVRDQNQTMNEYNGRLVKLEVLVEDIRGKVDKMGHQTEETNRNLNMLIHAIRQYQNFER